MHIYRTIDAVPFFENTVCTIGMFDGVHLGHQAMLRQLLETAAEKNSRPLVITFDPHPLMILSEGAGSVSLLTTTQEKSGRFEALGIDHVLLLPFSKEMAGLTAEAFIHDILIRQIGLAALLVGFNHTLGHDRGTLEDIQRLGIRYRFTSIAVPPVIIGDENVSSTGIRQALQTGNLDRANQWLGCHYAVDGEVIRGLQIGRELGFPTANLKTPSEKLIPKDGVYACTVLYERLQYGGVANIGYSPSIQGKTWGIEIYIDNFKEIIYNKCLDIQFVKRLRDEIKFDTIDALKEQIQNDQKNARQLLAPYIRR